MLEQDSIDFLKTTKNLLAFSAGIDSTALLFFLLKNEISFDIAIIDYQKRKQSKEEVAYAKSLSKQYNFTCFIHLSKNITKNFEAEAREERYNFFEKIISLKNYQTLLTAHHLGDRFEWMIMQFCKGAGCLEIAGMKKKEKRKNYTLFRPLLHLEKTQLLSFLNKENMRYFIDDSNNDKTIKRNEFRHQFTNPLLKKYLNGIRKSFTYIDDDKKLILQNIKIKTVDDFAYFKSSKNKRSDIVAIDKYIKSKYHIMTHKEKALLKNEIFVEIGRKYIIIQKNKLVFIAPSTDKKIVISKKLKENMRTLSIHPKLRPYLSLNKKALKKVKKLIQK